MNKSTAPPAASAQVACPCCLATYRYSDGRIRRGKIQPNPACRQKRSPNSEAKSGSKLDGALLVGACLIAAVRMGSAEVRPSPKLTATVADSVRLAREILGKLGR